MISTYVAKLRLRMQFLVLLSVLMYGFLFFGQQAWRTIQDIRIGGVMYQNIIRSKDLVADILPPPSYIIESYLVTLQLSDASELEEQQRLQVRLERLKAAYDANHQQWLKAPLEAEIKAQFLGAAHEPAERFYAIAFSKYIPALRRADVAAKEASLKELVLLYEQHRKAIDQVVILANQKNKVEEALAQSVIEKAQKVMVLSLVIPIVLALTLFVLITKPLISSLSALRIKFHAMAQGDLSQNFASTRKDEVGEIFASAAFMQNELSKATTILQQENKERLRVEALLRKAPEELKRRVLERTRELKTANERLELEILERKRIEQELLESREKLRARSAHLEAIREEERKHIAMEIHDELGQLLSALKMDIALLRNLFAKDEEAIKKTNAIRDLVEKTILVVRNVSTQLRPGVLNLGVVPALEWLAENFSQRNAIPCETDIQCGEINMEDAEATTIFRIVQESLTNVMRHAAATNVVISLVLEGEGLNLHIKDDGKGFDLDDVNKHPSNGLFGMRERARLIKGCLHIDSQLGQGTSIWMRIPFEKGGST